MAEIHLEVPSAIHAKLTELAGFRSLEDWTRDLLIRAAEDIQPSLKTSGLWRRDVGDWSANCDNQWDSDD